MSDELPAQSAEGYSIELLRAEDIASNLASLRSAMLAGQRERHPDQVWTAKRSLDPHSPIEVARWGAHLQRRHAELNRGLRERAEHVGRAQDHPQPFGWVAWLKGLRAPRVWMIDGSDHPRGSRREGRESDVEPPMRGVDELEDSRRRSFELLAEVEAYIAAGGFVLEELDFDIGELMRGAVPTDPARLLGLRESRSLLEGRVRALRRLKRELGAKLAAVDRRERSPSAA